MPGTSKLAASLHAHVAHNARHSIYHHPDDAAIVASTWIPDKRTREVGPVNDDHFIREEGIFSGLSESQLKALATPDAEGGRGFTLADLPWPIPGRVFVWTPAS